MPALYITQHGDVLRHRQKRLMVERNGQEIATMPLAHVERVVLLGNAVITTPTIKFLLYHGVDVVFLTENGAYCGRLTGPFARDGELRRRQYAASLHPELALQLAKDCVGGKLRNMRTQLLRYRREHSQTKLDPAIDQLERMGRAIEQASHKNSLLGYEGSASAVYFRVLPLMLKHDWGFAKRVRQPPTDPVNVLLSFAYTLLFKQMEAAVQLVGLDPYIGFLHEPLHGRASLALDLIEEFRPIIADSVVLRCLNSELITPADFSAGNQPQRPIVLSQAGVQRFISEFENRMNMELQHPVTGEKSSYRRCFELQAYAMAHAVRHGQPYLPLLTR